MKFSWAKLLNVSAIIIALLLLASCANSAKSDSSEKPTNVPLESAEPAAPDSPAPESNFPLVSDIGSWQVRHISPRIYGEDWMVINDNLWYFNDKGIYYLDLKTGQETNISGPNVYNTMFYVDCYLWFAYNYLGPHNYEGISEDQISLARVDLASKQYYEYPTDIFTGVKVTVLKSLGKVIVCAGSKVYQYDKADDQFIEMPEYGDDVLRVAGNEKIFAMYTGDSLKLYYANGELKEYNPTDCLPDTYVTNMNIFGDELFTYWGGEGEPAGVSCINTQTGVWTHFIDPMSKSDFSTPHEYILIAGSGGNILPRGEETVYIPIIYTATSPKSLLEFSFSKRELECVYTAEEFIWDAIPFQNGDIIRQSNEIVFCDLDNGTENIIENMEIIKVIKKSQDTVLAITDQGVFECKFTR